MNILKLSPVLFSILIGVLSVAYGDSPDNGLKRGSQSLTPQEFDALRYSPGNDFLTLQGCFKKLSKYPTSSVNRALKANPQEAGGSMSQEDIDIQKLFPVLLKSLRLVVKENGGKGVVDSHVFGSDGMPYLPKETVNSLLKDIDSWSKQVGIDLEIVESGLHS